MSFFRRLERLAEGGSGLAAFELAQAIDASLSKGASPHEGFNGAHARAAGHYVCVRSVTALCSTIATLGDGVFGERSAGRTGPTDGTPE